MTDRPSTLDDRVARAAARWARAVSSCHRGQLRLHQSEWLLLSSRAVLDRPRPAFRGGVDAVPDEASLQRRLRHLLRKGVLPAIHVSLVSAGPCRVRRECEVCDASIRPGDIEFLVRLPLATMVAAVVVHRRCFDLWAREAATFVADGRP